MSILNSRLERYSMVSRLVAHQTEQGIELSDALKNIRTALPKEYGGEIEAIAKIAGGDSDAVLSGIHGHTKIFIRLSKVVLDAGGNLEKLFPTTQIFLRDVVSTVKEFWSGFYSLVSYLLVVTFIGLLILSIFTLKVGGSMLETFESFKQQLPQFSQLIFVHHEVYFTALCLGILIIIGCIIVVQHIKQQVNSFLPLGRWIKYIPQLNKLSEIYGYFIFIHYADLIIKSNVASEIAINSAKQMAFPDSVKLNNRELNQWVAAMDAAKKLGCIEAEIAFQKKQIETLFSHAMITTRERLTLFTQLVLGCFIGLMLLAMYLPIFQLGSVVGD